LLGIAIEELNHGRASAEPEHRGEYILAVYANRRWTEPRAAGA
jgi:hypothetical protein